MLDLLDYRRRVHTLYGQIRQLGTDHVEAFSLFRQTRDDLYKNHSQSVFSPAERDQFDGLNYFDYDPAYRVVAQLDTDFEPQSYKLDLSDDGKFVMEQIGTVRFTLPTGNGELGVFWVKAYGGGIFIPFRDATNTYDTYGGGRYLYDTVKGADLGTTDDSIILDFNYAYHPSCYYNPRWDCPLAPVQNRLSIPVNAGEVIVDLPEIKNG
jgi:uncharacterized protein (DUF1684 family)